MADRDDDELSPDERALLTRWQPPAAPGDFAARVMAPRPPARARARAARWLGGAALAGVAAITAAVAWPGGASTTARPAAAVAHRQVAAAREAVRLGARGVAVAEPGAALAWQQIGPAARVEQDAGDVFYRVDPGGPFTVVTPVGRIQVTGTCFRVEIIMSPFKQAALGGAIGAVVATAAVVTVYEGKIVVVGDGGTKVAAAGEQVTVRPGEGPVVVARTDGPAPPAGGPPTIALQLPAAPTDATSREELIARDKVQREQLAMMASRIQELERGRRGGGGGGGGGLDDGSWIDPTPAELADWAKVCRVRIDMPPVMRGEPMRIPPEAAKAAGLGDAEVATANQVFVELAADWGKRVRAWYVEATGDAAGADALSAFAMGQELQDKATPREPEALQKRIAEERAGFSRAPTAAELTRASPYERYFRSMAGLGDEAERLLAEKLGAERAHTLRKHDGGWPMRMQMEGCSDEADNGGGNAAPMP